MHDCLTLEGQVLATVITPDGQSRVLRSSYNRILTNPYQRMVETFTTTYNVVELGVGDYAETEEARFLQGPNVVKRPTRQATPANYGYILTWDADFDREALAPYHRALDQIERAVGVQLAIREVGMYWPDGTLFSRARLDVIPAVEVEANTLRLTYKLALGSGNDRRRPRILPPMPGDIRDVL